MNKVLDNYLKDDFYYVDSKTVDDSTFNANIRFNASHWIYSCHFPENHITPGVCIVQVARELIAEHYRNPFKIAVLKNIKFMNIINPVTSGVVRFACTLQNDTDGNIRATCTVENDSMVFSKISMILCPL